MNYIWEMGIRTKRQAHDIRFMPSRGADPYREITLTNINQTYIATEVEVNPYYRFSTVYDGLQQICETGKEEFLLAVFDIVFHFLMELDLQSGMSKREYYKSYLRREISEGVFGPKYLGLDNCFHAHEVNAILEALLTVPAVGFTLVSFTQLVKVLFPKSLVYLETRKGKELLVYLGVKQTPQRQHQIEILTDLFVPIEYEYYIFWDRHFGIIGVDETMQMDEIQIFG